MSDNVKNAVITGTDKEIEWEDKEIFDILINFLYSCKENTRNVNIKRNIN